MMTALRSIRDDLRVVLALLNRTAASSTIANIKAMDFLLRVLFLFCIREFTQ